MSISSIMDLAKQGIDTHRAAMQTTSQNIANANTPYYSRQRPVLETRPTYSTQGVRVGGGVEISKVIRIHNQFVQNHIFEEAKQFGELKVRSENLSRLEKMAGLETEGLRERLNAFFNQARELSTSPEMANLRYAFKESAKNVASGFHRANETLENSRLEVERQIEITVDRINFLGQELATLNQAISGLSSIGGNPNELMDQRELVVKELSEKMGFPVSMDDQNNYNLIAPGIGIVVQGVSNYPLKMARTAPTTDSNDQGRIDIFIQGPTVDLNATTTIKTGELAGLLHVRDKVILPALKQLDQTAFEFSTRVNQAHAEGVSLDGESGRNLFNTSDKVQGASRFLELNSEVEMTPEKIAVGLDASSPADNQVVLKISEIQNGSFVPTVTTAGTENPMTYTVLETLNNITTAIASDAKGSLEMATQQRSVMEQLDNYRDSISGVSLEEEAMNLMQQQAAFNAAVKTLKVGDELLETILSIKD